MHVAGLAFGEEIASLMRSEPEWTEVRTILRPGPGTA